MPAFESVSAFGLESASASVFESESASVFESDSTTAFVSPSSSAKAWGITAEAPPVFGSFTTVGIGFFLCGMGFVFGGPGNSLYRVSNASRYAAEEV